MKILGLGSDIVGVARFTDLLARYGGRFLDRCFTPEETAFILSRGLGAPASAAARWAAKEAFLKALGSDVRHIPYRDIEVTRSPAGPVALRLHGRAQAAAQATGALRWHLTMSHEKDYATATVILEKE